ncbi:hypothetical protein CERSUDRAFT_101464 [Gelatoporia subvermispora B]|uniref:Uncharacterized protein n=1 Tax=Ceriporiopsis subvermispora (strain B) TaxID=914234 RepID=M2QWP4_CERS8|nr:hypothetical protein CERSUDRAFT_101464 [Gelatoporia subvermispora B]
MAREGCGGRGRHGSGRRGRTVVAVGGHSGHSEHHGARLARLVQVAVLDNSLSLPAPVYSTATRRRPLPLVLRPPYFAPPESPLHPPARPPFPLLTTDGRLSHHPSRSHGHRQALLVRRPLTPPLLLHAGRAQQKR